jgi:hypothetical protein
MEETIVEKFHKMELKYKLFELGGETPYWDLVRYNVYLKYYYAPSSQIYLGHHSHHKLKDYVIFGIQTLCLLWRIFFRKYKFLFLTDSNKKMFGKEGYYYDPISFPLIKEFGSSLILDNFYKGKTPYTKTFDLSNAFIRTSKSVEYPKAVYEVIEKALIDSFGENRVNYNFLNSLYKAYVGQFRFYTFILKHVNPQKVVIARGNPKGIIKACKDLHIPCCLLQHESIEKDEINWSYPEGITCDSNLLFAPMVGTFGSYWLKNVNVPTKEIIPIGNDEKFKKLTIESDGSFLIISSIVHCTELKPLTKELAQKRPDLKFVYKLHPDEFYMKDEVVNYFAEQNNIKVISTENSTQELIYRSRMVIAIVSACVYESLHAGKVVAIYKRLNYRRQEYLLPNPDIFFFDNSDEFYANNDRAYVEMKEAFYMPFNISNCNKLIERDLI